MKTGLLSLALGLAVTLPFGSEILHAAPAAEQPPQVADVDTPGVIGIDRDGKAIVLEPLSEEKRGEILRRYQPSDRQLAQIREGLKGNNPRRAVLDSTVAAVRAEPEAAPQYYLAGLQVYREITDATTRHAEASMRFARLADSIARLVPPPAIPFRELASLRVLVRTAFSPVVDARGGERMLVAMGEAVGYAAALGAGVGTVSRLALVAAAADNDGETATDAARAVTKGAEKGLRDRGEDPAAALDAVGDTLESEGLATRTVPSDALVQRAAQQVAEDAAGSDGDGFGGDQGASNIGASFASPASGGAGAASGTQPNDDDEQQTEQEEQAADSENQSAAETASDDAQTTDGSNGERSAS